MANLKVLVGTSKGVFILTRAKGSEEWGVSGPFCDLWPINHVIGDAATGQLWAGGGSEWQGAGIWRSNDGGVTWTLSQLSHGSMAEWAANDPDFAEMIGGVPAPAPFTGDIDSIWSLVAVDGRLFAGSKPAHFFTSADGGETWEKLPALSDHPSRDDWSPGGAGLTLHTIVPKPDTPGHMTIAISAAGVFTTEDGGGSWERSNRLDNAPSHNHPHHGNDGEIGHCVHNMVRAPSEPDRLYQQNHHGVFRSTDGGRNWRDITEGLPSSFGFPISVHPDDPLTLWTIPMNGDIQGRYPPGASAAVWKSVDGGESWAAMREGLPQENCYFTVLRQAMATDRSSPVGVYFGTNTGSVFASGDEGETWTEIARHLPTVLSVEALQSA